MRHNPGVGIMKSVFSLAARRTGPPREGCGVGGRAGELKTDWTKPLPPPLGLCVLNARIPLGSAPSGHRERQLEAICRANQAAERSVRPESGHLAVVQALRKHSWRKRPHPDLAGGSA